MSKVLMNKKVLFITVAVFMVICFAVPIQDKVNYNLMGLAKFLVNPGQYFVMVGTLMLTMFVFSIKNFHSFIERHINRKAIYFLIYAVIVICTICFLLKTTEIWGTWSSFGLYIVTVLIMPVILEDIPKIDALLLGAGAVYVIVALWEMPYQYGLWWAYELPQGENISFMYAQLLFLVPFIILGGTIVGIVIYNNYKSLKFRWKLPVIFLAYTIVAFLVRFATGFWTDIYFNLKQNAWLYTPPNPAMLILYRTTKVSLNLSFLTMFWSWKWMLG